MFESSANSLTTLELQAIGGLILDDLLQVLEHCGPTLQRLVLRSCRYVSLWRIHILGHDLKWSSMIFLDERLHRTFF